MYKKQYMVQFSFLEPQIPIKRNIGIKIASKTHKSNKSNTENTKSKNNSINNKQLDTL